MGTAGGVKGGQPSLALGNLKAQELQGLYPFYSRWALWSPVWGCYQWSGRHRSRMSVGGPNTHFHQIYIQECNNGFLRYLHVHNPIISPHFVMKNFEPTENWKELFNELCIRCHHQHPSLTALSALSIHLPTPLPTHYSIFIDIILRKKMDTKLSKSH